MQKPHATRPVMKRGCLVVHGFTGTPATVASLSQRLLSEDFRVVAPCLAGHGGTIDDLERSSWRDWYETVRVAYAGLRREVDEVLFVGLSMGTLLGLKLAVDEGWGVRALALVSTALELSLWNRVSVTLVRFTPLRYFINSIGKDATASVGDPEGRRLYLQQSLQRFPTRAVFELDDLQKVIRRELPKIHQPLLLIHARADRVTPYRNVALLKNAVASPMIETVILERSRHVIPLDCEQVAAAEHVVEFFNRVV